VSTGGCAAARSAQQTVSSATRRTRERNDAAERMMAGVLFEARDSRCESTHFFHSTAFLASDGQL
jgi:hypothetical protein